MMKRCGFCHYWGSEKYESGGFRPCLWPRPVLPFWAEIDEGRDHNDWTAPDQGTNCPTFAPKEPA